MTELVCELMISLDGFVPEVSVPPPSMAILAPDLADWIKTKTAGPHRGMLRDEQRRSLGI